MRTKLRNAYATYNDNDQLRKKAADEKRKSEIFSAARQAREHFPKRRFSSRMLISHTARRSPEREEERGRGRFSEWDCDSHNVYFLVENWINVYACCSQSLKSNFRDLEIAFLLQPLKCAQKSNSIILPPWICCCSSLVRVLLLFFCNFLSLTSLIDYFFFLSHETVRERDWKVGKHFSGKVKAEIFWIFFRFSLFFYKLEKRIWDINLSTLCMWDGCAC